MGLCEGVVPLIAYNFMANKGRMKDVIKAVIMSIGVIFVVCMIAVFTIGHHMVGLFTTDQAIVEMATFILKVTMTSLLLNGIGFLFTGMLQATGQGRGATIMAILTSGDHHSSIIYYECFVWTNRCHLVIINC